MAADSRSDAARRRCRRAGSRGRPARGDRELACRRPRRSVPRAAGQAARVVHLRGVGAMTPRSFPARGHTLLELAISLALGMMIVLAMLSLYRGARAAFDRASDAARVHEAGVSALDLIAQQIQMAGFGTTRADAALFGCSQARVVGADVAASCESLASRSDGVQ